MKKKPLPAQFDEVERQKLERLAAQWGISLSGTIRRIVREHPEPETTTTAK
jgi:hypothetical protein